MPTHCPMPYRTLFGPVPSRRLGISLGVDLVTPKTCSLDCVYCESGPTTHLTVQRREYVPVALVQAELADFLARHEKIDHITFSGSGEPTLNAGIGEVIAFIRAQYPRHRVALLTNSTLLDRPAVRRQVKDADVIMASVDAVTPEAFAAVNRPHPRLSLTAILDGLVQLRPLVRGRLIVEYFVVGGCNDAPGELAALKGYLERLRADGVVINTLDRPGTEAWVTPVDPARLKEISDFLEDADIVNYRATPSGRPTGTAELAERLVATVRRRPCTALDAATILGCEAAEVQPLLDRLVRDGRLVTQTMARGLFYLAS